MDASKKLIKFDERLFFTAFPEPVPHPDELNKPMNESARGRATVGPQTSSPAPSDEEDDQLSSSRQRQVFYFSIDDDLIYQSFSSDFGPLNLGHVYRFCLHLHELLQSTKHPLDPICLYSSSNPAQKVNAALLMALYVLIVQRRTPSEALRPLCELELLSFRDAGRGENDFMITVSDCLYGMWKALKSGLLNLESFDLKQYLYYERVENGDFNHVGKDFIAFASPRDHTSSKALSTRSAEKKLSHAFTNVLNYFEENNVHLVIRLNDPLYDHTEFENRGMRFLDWEFEDGTNPSDDMVKRFFIETDRVVSAGGLVAVHCAAGLGRTGCLIAAWLIYRHSFTAQEAIAYMRICRPGMLVGPQQQWLMLRQFTFSGWAAAEEAVAAYKSSLAVSASSRQITPPLDDLYHASHLPNVTPARYTSPSRPGAPTPPPGQPRKTPKRSAAASFEDEDLLQNVDEPIIRSPPKSARPLPPAPHVSTAAISGPPPSPEKRRANAAPPSAARLNNPAAPSTSSTRRVGPAPSTESKIAVLPRSSRNAKSPTPTARLPSTLASTRRAPLVPTSSGGVKNGVVESTAMGGKLKAMRGAMSRGIENTGRQLRKKRSTLSNSPI